jgi:hypothetical protein
MTHFHCTLHKNTPQLHQCAGVPDKNPSVPFKSTSVLNKSTDVLNKSTGEF